MHIRGGGREELAMSWDKSGTRKRTCLYLSRIVFLFIFFGFFSIPVPVSLFAQQVKTEEKEISDGFSHLVTNGAKMITDGYLEVALNKIEGLPPEKRADFRIRVLENFLSLKIYLAAGKKDFGKKWQSDYKAMLYTKNKTATAILVELLKDSDPYMRAFTARALGYLGDRNALEELKRVADHDKNSKVKSRAKWAYVIISEGKSPP